MPLPLLSHPSHQRTREQKERRGNCCVARYGGDVDLGRIMLRYRPIAPKPAVGAQAPYPALGTCGRTKRKRGKNQSRGKIKKSEVVTFKEDENKDHLILAAPSSSLNGSEAQEKQQKKGKENTDPEVAAVAWEVVIPTPVRQAGSWVTVERVTGTWGEGGVDKSSDEVVRQGLASETSPVFVSDAWDQVTWTNEAYRRMVVGPECLEEQEEMKVALVTRGRLPLGDSWRGFTCGVRVKYAWRGKAMASLAAPCDVLRLRDGSLAWRLDLKAALSLGLGM